MSILNQYKAGRKIFSSLILLLQYCFSLKMFSDLNNEVLQSDPMNEKLMDRLELTSGRDLDLIVEKKEHLLPWGLLSNGFKKPNPYKLSGWKITKNLFSGDTYRIKNDDKKISYTLSPVMIKDSNNGVNNKERETDLEIIYFLYEVLNDEIAKSSSTKCYCLGKFLEFIMICLIFVTCLVGCKTIQTFLKNKYLSTNKSKYGDKDTTWTSPEGHRQHCMKKQDMSSPAPDGDEVLTTPDGKRHHRRLHDKDKKGPSDTPDKKESKKGNKKTPVDTPDTPDKKKK